MEDFDDYEEKTEEEKETIIGYTVKASVWINGKRIIYAKDETGTKDMPYLKTVYVPNDLFGSYESSVISSGYEEIMGMFADDIKAEAIIRATENRALGAENMPPFTVRDVKADDMTDNLVGKVVAMKPQYLADGYKSLNYQLFYVTGGNGANPNAMGRACFCKRLRDGEGTRIERYQVLGIVSEDKLPDFARKTLEKIKTDKEQTERLPVKKEDRDAR